MIKKLLASSILFSVITIPLPSISQAGVFDDFSGDTIDGNKWKNQELVREVKSGKLVTGIRINTDQTGGYGNRTQFQNPNTIYKMQASVKIDSYNFDTSITDSDHQDIGAELQGNFYRDASGDVLAGIALIDFTGPDGLQAGCHVESEGGSEAAQMFTMAVSAGTSYSLSIGYNETSGEFICRIENESTTASEEITLARPTDDLGDPANGYKALTTFYSIHDEPNGAFEVDAAIFASYDNVEVNDGPYDDFNTAPIDINNWSSREIVRKVNSGRLQLTQQNVGMSRETNRMRTADSVQGGDFFQVDITMDGNSQISGSTATFGQAIAGGFFYNDTHDGSYNGREGDNYARIHLQLNSLGTLVANARIWRCDNVACSSDSGVWSQDFTTAPAEDVPQTVSIERVGSVLKFKMNDEVIEYTVIGNIFNPSHAQRRLTTRVNSTDGEQGHVTAYFDNVYLQKPNSFAWNLFLPAIVSKQQAD